MWNNEALTPVVAGSLADSPPQFASSAAASMAAKVSSPDRLTDEEILVNSLLLTRML
jgi:hypothetical protein